MAKKVCYGLKFTCPKGFSTHQFFITSDGKPDYGNGYTEHEAIKILEGKGWEKKAAVAEIQAARSANKNNQTTHKQQPFKRRPMNQQQKGRRYYEVRA
jgi:hypothetical protein